MSQAHLLSVGALLRDEPLARQVGWPDAEWTFSPFGYRPGAHGGEIVPTYPPGLPLVMASARAIASDDGPFVVVPLLGAVAVFCTYALGARLHSRLAGLIAAALLATSPIVLFQIVQPMSDVPVMAWWALALTFALLPGSRQRRLRPAPPPASRSLLAPTSCRSSPSWHLLSRCARPAGRF